MSLKIIGFSLSKINAERYKPQTGSLSIKSDISIINISTQKLALFNSQEVLSIEFEFKVSYMTKNQQIKDNQKNKNKKENTPENIADITLSGEIIITAEKQEIFKISGDWKNKKLDEEIKISIYNAILNKCLTKALQLEDEFNLPHHVPIPKLSPHNSQQTNKNPQASPQKNNTNQQASPQKGKPFSPSYAH